MKPFAYWTVSLLLGVTFMNFATEVQSMIGRQSPQFDAAFKYIAWVLVFGIIVYGRFALEAFVNFMRGEG